MKKGKVTALLLLCWIGLLLGWAAIPASAALLASDFDLVTPDGQINITALSTTNHQLFV